MEVEHDLFGTVVTVAKFSNLVSLAIVRLFSTFGQ